MECDPNRIRKADAIGIVFRARQLFACSRYKKTYLTLLFFSLRLPRMVEGMASPLKDQHP